MTHDTPGTNNMINGWLLIRDNGGQKADEWHIQSARGKKKNCQQVKLSFKNEGETKAVIYK